MGEEEIIKIFVLSNSHETKLPYFLFSSLLRRLVFFHFSLRDEYNEEINQSTHLHVVNYNMLQNISPAKVDTYFDLKCYTYVRTN